MSWFPVWAFRNVSARILACLPSSVFNGVLLSQLLPAAHSMSGAYALQPAPKLKFIIMNASLVLFSNWYTRKPGFKDERHVVGSALEVPHSMFHTQSRGTKERLSREAEIQAQSSPQSTLIDRTRAKFSETASLPGTPGAVQIVENKAVFESSRTAASIEESSVEPENRHTSIIAGTPQESLMDGECPGVQSEGLPAIVQDMPSGSPSRQVSGINDNTIAHKFRCQTLDAVRRGGLGDALKYYAEFTKLARTDLQVADALIRALCWGTLQAPPRSHVLQALRIYKDLVEAEQQQDADNVSGYFDSKKSPSAEKQQTFTRIYNALLRALSAPLSAKVASRDSGPEMQEQYTNFSMELLSDMKTRSLLPDNRTITSILLLQFRRARNHEEAFGYYRSLVTELESAASRCPPVSGLDFDHGPASPGVPPLLDLRGYRAVLNAFGKLSFPGAPVAPAHLWFAIAKDMRSRGHAVTVQDYTIFLGGILAQKSFPFTLRRAAVGIPSARSEEDRMRAMIACVKHVHQQLTIDQTIVPDAALLNTLMNVYQHLGHFDDALRVFNTVWISGRMDNVTPAIIFDACGHSRRPREAAFIWCMLIAGGWQFDKRTLDAWVECLCRIGNVEAACKFVCMYMGRGKAGYLSRGDTQPDVQTCLILLKLSWLAGQNLDVKERIRTHLPHLWNRLTAHYT